MKKYRIRKKYPILAYAGSLIQQNHGENIKGHGYVLWDLDKKEFNHHEIQNEYGHFTVEMSEGKLLTDINDLPKKVRLRIKYKNSTPSDLKKCVQKIESVSELIDVSYIREESSDFDNGFSSGINIHDITDISYQNKLIEDQLSKKKLAKYKIEKIKKINEELNNKLPSDSLPNNVRWKPISFEFDNMFSYGENNFIDFEKLNNVVGLFANNADGKCVDKNTEIEIEFDEKEIIKKLGFLPDELK